MRNSNDDESKICIEVATSMPQKNYVFCTFFSFKFEIRFDKMEERIVEDGVDYFRTH